MENFWRCFERLESGSTAVERLFQEVLCLDTVDPRNHWYDSDVMVSEVQYFDYIGCIRQYFYAD